MTALDRSIKLSPLALSLLLAGFGCFGVGIGAKITKAKQAGVIIMKGNRIEYPAGYVYLVQQDMLVRADGVRCEMGRGSSVQVRGTVRRGAFGDHLLECRSTVVGLYSRREDAEASAAKLSGCYVAEHYVAGKR